jgi:hypothetical protein
MTGVRLVVRFHYSCEHDKFGKHVTEYDPAGDTWCDRPPDRDIDIDQQPVLVLDEDGDFRIDYKGKTGEKNLLWGEWTETIVWGQFYLVPVPGTIESNIDSTDPA